jgi:hypothetical protein
MARLSVAIIGCGIGKNHADELITALYHSAATDGSVALPIGTGHPRYRGWH